MAEKYPQGLKKNPIKVVNPNGSITKYNSYREAMDVTDNMGKAVANEHFSPLGGQDAFAKADKQARKQGYDRPNLGGLEPVMDKLRTTGDTVEKHNADWMTKTASKKSGDNSFKPYQSVLPTLSKQIMKENGKRK